MFGIMRPLQACGTDAQEYRRHRMHYCGTCKTIGRHYGQAARLSLNYDVVFLAELLSALQQEDLATWSPAYQHINQCLDLPQEGEAQPLVLRFAAALNLFLAELKLRDHLADGGAKWWHKKLHTWASPRLQTAVADLENMGLDAQVLYDWVDLQVDLEAQKQREADLEATLLHYAQPTAQTTRVLLDFAAELLQFNAETKEKVAQLAYDFGTYTYILDAWEDWQKDQKKGAFNAILLHYEGQTLDLETARTALLWAQNRVLEALQALNLSADLQEAFSARFLQHSSNKIYGLYVEEKGPKPSRWARAQVQASAYLCPDGSWQHRVQHSLLSVAVFTLPQTSTYYHHDADTRAEVFKWTLFGMAFFTALGLSIKSLWSPPAERKERKGFWARWRARRARRKAAKRNNDCFTECIGACLVACCWSACELMINSMCQNACNDGCDAMCNGNAKSWQYFLLTMLVLLVIAALLMLFLI